jgi:hypothetical protein
MTAFATRVHEQMVVIEIYKLVFQALDPRCGASAGPIALLLIIPAQHAGENT